MKKLVIAIAVLVLSYSVLVAAPAAGKYGDVLDMLLKMEKVFANFSAGANNVKVAADAVKVVNEFKVSMVAMIPLMKTLREKYPNFEDFKKNPPAEIKEVSDRIKKASKGMQGLVQAKLMPFMTDPAVQKAFMEMGVAMQALSALEKKAPEKKAK